MKKIITILLISALCLCLSACGKTVDMTADLEPKDFEPIVYVPIDDALKVLGITAEDFPDDVYVDGVHQSGLKVSLCGQEFDFWIQSYNGMAQDYFFLYRQPLDDDGMRIYFDLVEKLKELYGEPVDPSTYGVIDLGQGFEREHEKWLYDDWQINVESIIDNNHEEPYMRLDLYISPNFEIVREGTEIYAVP